MTASRLRSLPRRTVEGACILATVFLSSGVLAHETDSPGYHEHRVGYDPEAHRSKQSAAFEIRIGPYASNVDSGLSGTPYADAFGTKPSVSFGIEGDYQVLRIPYLGTLAPALGWHWFRKGGIAEFTDGTAGSAHTNSLWVMPMFLVGVLRADILMHRFHIPLVPYIKGGLAWSVWESRDAGKVSVADGEKARGSSIGLQYQLGLMLHLNPLAEQTATDMDTSSGVNNAYLFIEWWASDVDSFGSGMQTGDATWVAGLTIEY